LVDCIGCNLLEYIKVKLIKPIVVG